MLRIYADGSCKGNGTKESIGGWAYVVVDKNDNILLQNTGAESNTTNNKMEMTAIINSIDDTLEYLEDLEVKYYPDIKIYTDSAYTYNGLTEGWYKTWVNNGWKTSSKTPVKNKELWLKLIEYFENPIFTFHKVKGHAENKWNNYVDELAQAAAAQELKEVL